MHYSDIEAAELARRWHESVLSATAPYLMSGTARPLLRDLLDVENVTDYADSGYTKERVCFCVQAVRGQLPAALLAEGDWNSKKPHCDANQYERN